MNLSAHISLIEFTQSFIAAKHQIDNTLPQTLFNAAKHTAKQLERIRQILDNNPIAITSGYRSSALNVLIGDADNQSHARAEAVDFTCQEFGTPRQICLRILASDIAFDQLILEYPENGWVHVGFSVSANRYQVLTSVRRNGKTVYLPGIMA